MCECLISPVMYNKAERFFVNKTNGVKTDCINQAKVTSVTSSRWGNWLATLTAPNIVIQRAPVTNPSSCMMSAMTEFVLEDEGEMTHDCVTLTYAATSEIAETPIENAELELFVDGSAQVIEGNRRAGYAVTSTTEVVASGRLPDHFSAQAAELVALTRACTLASGSVLQQLQCCVREGKPGLMCHTVKLFPHLQG